MTRPVQPPLLASVCPLFRDDLARSTLDAICRADGYVRIERLDPFGRMLDLGWTTTDGGKGRVRVSLFDEVAARIGGDPAAILAGVEAALHAALDPDRRLDPRRGHMALGTAICVRFAHEVPPTPGASDVAEIHTPCPWGGLVTVRVGLPPYSSGVTSHEVELRTEHALPDLVDRVETAIGPTAHVAVRWPEDATGPVLEIMGGHVSTARGSHDDDPMERLRTEAELDRLLSIGIRPVDATAGDEA